MRLSRSEWIRMGSNRSENLGIIHENSGKTWKNLEQPIKHLQTPTKQNEKQNENKTKNTIYRHPWYQATMAE